MFCLTLVIAPRRSTDHIVASPDQSRLQPRHVANVESVQKVGSSLDDGVGDDLVTAKEERSALKGIRENVRHSNASII